MEPEQELGSSHELTVVKKHQRERQGVVGIWAGDWRGHSKWHYDVLNEVTVQWWGNGIHNSPLDAQEPGVVGKRSSYGSCCSSDDLPRPPWIWWWWFSVPSMLECPALHRFFASHEGLPSHCIFVSALWELLRIQGEEETGGIDEPASCSRLELKLVWELNLSPLVVKLLLWPSVLVLVPGVGLDCGFNWGLVSVRNCFGHCDIKLYRSWALKLVVFSQSCAEDTLQSCGELSRYVLKLCSS